jgi:hypothetical protein
MLGCNGDEKVPHTAKPRLSTKYIQTYVQEDVQEDVKQEDVNRGCKRLVNKLKQVCLIFG